MKTTLIDISKLNTRDSPQVRERINESVMLEYREAMQRGEKFPPIEVADTNEGLLLIDGYHRVAAFAGLSKGTKIQANITKMNKTQAIATALHANVEHGLRRSNEDKRQCVLLALRTWPDQSNVSISNRCKVDDKTVAKIRRELESAGAIKETATRVSRDGKKMPAKVMRPANKNKAVKDARQAAKSPDGKARQYVDALGKAIPVACNQYWERSHEVVDFTSALKEVRDAVASRDGDKLYVEVNMKQFVANLNQAMDLLRAAVPYAVCPVCQGHPETQKGECRLCSGRGLVSYFRYSLTPEKVKKMNKSGK